MQTVDIKMGIATGKRLKLRETFEPLFGDTEQHRGKPFVIIGEVASDETGDQDPMLESLLVAQFPDGTTQDSWYEEVTEPHE